MKRLFILLCIAMCSACVFRSVNGAYDGVSGEYPTTAQSLAAQAAGEMSRRYPPGRTSLALNAAPGAFGSAFEEQLRRRGFAVRPGGQFADVGVSYTLDMVQNEPSCYLRVNLSDGGSFGYAKELAPEADVPVTMPPSASHAGSTVESRTLPDPPVMPLPEKAAVPVQTPVAASKPSVAPKPLAVNAVSKRGRTPTGKTGEPASARVFTPATTVAALTAAQSAQPVSLPEAAPTRPSVPLSYIYKPLDAASAAPVVSAADDRWEITPGGLRGQIHGWTARAGYTLVWHTDRDYEMSSYTAFRGDFLDAVKRFFSGLQRAGYPVRVTIYKGNQTLEITED
jgi:hypothetical protein